jgi:hypothetical protein
MEVRIGIEANPESERLPSFFDLFAAFLAARGPVNADRRGRWGSILLEVWPTAITIRAEKCLSLAFAGRPIKERQYAEKCKRPKAGAVTLSSIL